MRLVDRICLYLVVGFVAFSVLDGVRADDESKDGVKPGVIEATQIEIKNDAGQVVLRLGTSKSGGGEISVLNKRGLVTSRLYARDDHDGELQLYDVDGKLRTTIGANDVGGYANFFNVKGAMACYIGADGDAERGYVAVYGDQDEKIVQMLGNSTGGKITVKSMTGESAIEISAASKGGLIGMRNYTASAPVVVLGAAPDTGVGVCVIRGAAGQNGIQMHTSEHGGQFSVFNTAGKKIGFLGASASPAGNGLTYVARDDGERLWEAGRNSSRGGYMSVKNGLGKRVVFLGATTGDEADDGVLEVSTRTDKLGVVLRAYGPQSSVRVYDTAGKPKSILK